MDEEIIIPSRYGRRLALLDFNGEGKYSYIYIYIHTYMEEKYFSLSPSLSPFKLLGDLKDVSQLQDKKKRKSEKNCNIC